MDESLLAVLRVCLLLVLYLFFFRVVRTVWAGLEPAALVRAPPPESPAGGSAPSAPTRARGRGVPTALVVVEPPESAGRRHELGSELTIGRAAGCQITVDDGYASQLHARVFIRENRPYVEDLGSTNGTFLGDARLTTERALAVGDRLRIGSTVFEARS